MTKTTFDPNMSFEEWEKMMEKKLGMNADPIKDDKFVYVEGDISIVKES